MEDYGRMKAHLLSLYDYAMYFEDEELAKIALEGIEELENLVLTNKEK